MPVFGKMRPNTFFHNGYSGQMMQYGPVGQQWNRHLVMRNQAFPYQPPVQNQTWNTFQSQGGYHPSTFQPMGPAYQLGSNAQNMNYQNSQYPQKDSQFLFQNPLQPKEDMYPAPYAPMNGYPVMNPYPKQSFIPKQPSGMQSLMNSFKSQDGSVDFNKMMNTAGQMVNAVTQVSSLVKNFSGIFKA